MKPILFSTPMVQAILEGRKTQTRRVVKPQPYQADMTFAENRADIDAVKLSAYKVKRDEKLKNRLNGLKGANSGCIAPYKPGDVLWVRETWKPQDYFFVDDIMSCQIIFKAGGPDNLNPRVFWNHGDDTIFESCGTWHPSIHMPRSAARLFLRVTGVRAERVQDISTSDCEEEGITSDIERFNGHMIPHHDWIVGEFSKLWDSINAKRGYGWDMNCWVWVYTFEKTEKPEVEG